VLPGLTSAGSRQVTPYGPAEAGWERTGDRVRVTALVPAGATAEVVLPDGTRHEVGSGAHAWEVDLADELPATELRGLDTDLADLVDDPDALAVVRAEVAAFDPGRARAFAGALRYEAGSTLRTALMFADPDGLDRVHAALTDLHDTRTTEETP
jgi:alpha-L-rhamnosidase